MSLKPRSSEHSRSPPRRAPVPRPRLRVLTLLVASKASVAERARSHIGDHLPAVICSVDAAASAAAGLLGDSVGGAIRRPRPPRLTWPPLRPAERASSAVHSWAVPFSCAARPPLLAISRCFSGDIDANPRRSLRSGVFTTGPPFFCARSPRTVPNHIWTLVIRLGRWILNPGGTRLVERRLRRIVGVVVPLVVVLIASRAGCESWQIDTCRADHHHTPAISNIVPVRAGGSAR